MIKCLFNGHDADPKDAKFAVVNHKTGSIDGESVCRRCGVRFCYSFALAPLPMAFVYNTVAERNALEVDLTLARDNAPVTQAAPQADFQALQDTVEATAQGVATVQNTLSSIISRLGLDRPQ
jgi:hypothetical protein